MDDDARAATIAALHAAFLDVEDDGDDDAAPPLLVDDYEDDAAPVLPVVPAPPEWYTPEDDDAQLWVTLVTASSLVQAGDAVHPPLRDPSDLSGADFLAAVLDCVANPVVEHPRGGRPRKVKIGMSKYIGVKEPHADNTSYHHHAAIKFTAKTRFLPFKLAMRQRHGLATHWSTSHSQFHSAVYYIRVTTEKKEVVDQKPTTWTPDGRELNLFEEAQRPFNAGIYKREREAELSLPFEKKPKKERFTKLDFKSLVVAKDLQTPPQVMAYVKKSGSTKMHAWVSDKQGTLKELIREAWEWNAAETDADAEAETDWALVERLAKKSCSCEGSGCRWWSMATEFFRNNTRIDQQLLAASLRKVIQFGPGKKAKVPLIKGVTNSGKSTMLDQVRGVYPKGAVLNKPKLGASCPLSRVAKGNIRFWYWDDYRPVDYATLPRDNPTVPATQFLAIFNGQPFDVTVSQSFNNGHPEMELHRGCAMTSLEDGLWEPRPGVSREEIRHFQSRVLEFHATYSIPEEDFETAPMCPESWCRWLLVDSLAYAQRSGPEVALSRPVRQGLALPPLPESQGHLQPAQDDDSDCDDQALLAHLLANSM